MGLKWWRQWSPPEGRMLSPNQAAALELGMEEQQEPPLLSTEHLLRVLFR